MQGAEDADLQAQFAGRPKHGAGVCAEQGIEERQVVVEGGPQQIGHGKRDVLPVAVGKDMALLRHPLFRGFEAEQLCGARNIHATEYKTGHCISKSSDLRSGDAHPVRALRSHS